MRVADGEEDIEQLLRIGLCSAGELVGGSIWVRVQRGREGPVLDNVSMREVHVRHMSHSYALQFTASHQPP